MIPKFSAIPVKAGLYDGTLHRAHLQGEGRVMVRTGHSFCGAAVLLGQGGHFQVNRPMVACKLMHPFGGKI